MSPVDVIFKYVCGACVCVPQRQTRFCRSHQQSDHTPLPTQPLPVSRSNYIDTPELLVNISCQSTDAQTDWHAGTVWANEILGCKRVCEVGPFYNALYRCCTTIYTPSGPGASILGGLGEQSSTFLKMGVDRLVISTNLLPLDRQIFAWKVKCALLCRMWGRFSHP